jgi:hypothetical protein
MLVYQLRSTIRRGVTKREIRAARAALDNTTPHIAVAVTGGVGDSLVVAAFCET